MYVPAAGRHQPRRRRLPPAAKYPRPSAGPSCAWVSEQFRRVRADEFNDRSFLALKQGLLAAETARWENNRERALAMAHAFVARGGWGSQLQYFQRLRAVTRDDVQRVAGEYFGERRLILRSRAGYPKKTRLHKPSYPAVTPERRTFAVLRRAARPPEAAAPRQIR